MDTPICIMADPRATGNILSKKDFEQLSFRRLKAALSTKTTLGYFDPKKPTSIFVDGSPISLQQRRPNPRGRVE